MRPGWFVKTQSVFFALVLHVAALLLLLISFSYTPELRPLKQISIVNAVVVDQARVDEEIKRLKQADEKKHQAEKQRVEELEKKLDTEKKKAEEIKSQRLEEEKQLLNTRKKKEEEQKKQEEAQKKVAELEQQRKLEEEKKVQAEADKKRLEEEKKKKDAELKKKEEEKKQQEAKKALQEQLNAEQAEEQRQQNVTLLQKIVNEITNKVIRNFNKSGLPDNLSCKLMVKLLPSGEVASVSLVETSGNDIFDRRALLAVEKSSPFTLPEEVSLEKFEQLDLRELSFNFIPPKD